MLGEISFGLQTVIGQLIALLTFFAFPAIQYIILKRLSLREGRPELWYVPAYGFRLVIRNIPNKKILSNLEYKTYVRRIVGANSESSVGTLLDETLVEKRDYFLFPGYDQILICFTIVGENKDQLKFVHTDKLGSPIKEISLAGDTTIVSDYSANIENLLNFDVKLAKRIILDRSSLISYWNAIKLDVRERKFQLNKIWDVG